MNLETLRDLVKQARNLLDAEAALDDQARGSDRLVDDALWDAYEGAQEAAWEVVQALSEFDVDALVRAIREG